MDLDEFIRIAIALEVGAYVGPKRLNAFYTEAGKRGINLIRPGTFAPQAAAATEAAGPSLARRAVGRVAARSPWIIGGAAGLEALRRSPELATDIVEQWEGAQERLGIPAEKRVKRKLSKFNKAIRAGMATVKKSTSYGKPGTFNNSKKAFAAVTKVASGLKKGRKAPKKGIRGRIARAIKRYI